MRYVYASIFCKTKPVLVRQPLANGSLELPETQTAGVDVDQVQDVQKCFDLGLPALSSVLCPCSLLAHIKHY